MATQQPQTMSKGRSASRNAGAKMSAARGGASATPSGATSTREPDETYGLISVLYHALQGAETYAQYVADARRAGDEELVEFFEECQDEEADRAERAKQLLAARVATEAAKMDEDEDEDEEEIDEEDDGEEAEDDR